MQLPELSKESLLAFAAYFSLFVTVAHVLLSKCAELVALLWQCFVQGVDAIERFRR